jgi:hypothetical protein
MRISLFLFDGNVIVGNCVCDVFLLREENLHHNPQRKTLVVHNVYASQPCEKFDEAKDFELQCQLENVELVLWCNEIVEWYNHIIANGVTKF